MNTCTNSGSFRYQIELGKATKKVEFQGKGCHCRCCYNIPSRELVSHQKNLTSSESETFRFSFCSCNRSEESGEKGNMSTLNEIPNTERWKISGKIKKRWSGKLLEIHCETANLLENVFWQFSKKRNKNFLCFTLRHQVQLSYVLYQQRGKVCRLLFFHFPSATGGGVGWRVLKKLLAAS